MSLSHEDLDMIKNKKEKYAVQIAQIKSGLRRVHLGEGLTEGEHYRFFEMLYEVFPKSVMWSELFDLNKSLENKEIDYDAFSVLYREIHKKMVEYLDELYEDL